MLDQGLVKLKVAISQGRAIEESVNDTNVSAQVRSHHIKSQQRKLLVGNPEVLVKDVLVQTTRHGSVIFDSYKWHRDRILKKETPSSKLNAQIQSRKGAKIEPLQVENPDVV